MSSVPERFVGVSAHVFAYAVLATLFMAVIVSACTCMLYVQVSQEKAALIVTTAKCQQQLINQQIFIAALDAKVGLFEALLVTSNRTAVEAAIDRIVDGLDKKESEISLEELRRWLMNR